MIKGKLPIKLILSNWYILLDSQSLEIVDIISSIQSAIYKMYDTGELDEDDLMILDTYQQGYNFEEISKLIKISRQTISNRINRIAARIEIIAGDIYE